MRHPFQTQLDEGFVIVSEDANSKDVRDFYEKRHAPEALKDIHCRHEGEGD
jgi:hypothetical protein